MRDPATFTREELLAALFAIRSAMFWDWRNERWERDREVNGGDLVEACYGEFERLDWIPDREDSETD